MTNRVVITGMGTINPLGKTVAEAWQNAVEGVSSVGPITQFDASDLLVQIACEVKDFDPTHYMDARVARRRDRFELFASAAAQDAMAQSGLTIDDQNAGRVAVIISTGVGGIQSLEAGVNTLATSGARRLSPFLIPQMMPNGPSGLVAIDHGAKGPSFSVASACASSADGVGQAWLLIRSGMADAAIAGGSEATITKIGIGGFDRVGALSRRNEDHSMTPQPFDLNRDGLVMGEGAGIMILESLDHARARGAEILAELVGYTATADAFHVTAPAKDGSGGSAAIKGALNLAELHPEQVDYINAHGTGTQLNDVSETRAIKSALGDHAYKVQISSSKSMTGHMMGATGALESVFCIQAIRDNMVPPTINYEEPDEICDLDYIPNEAREKPVRIASTHAFGFGGHNAVLIFKKFDGK